MKKLHNSFKKLNKRELKSIQGGNIPVVPIGCNSWDFKARCCREWDWEHSENPTCL
ncbi:bacteriocin [Chryseobacterium arthrosphaerae]|uniref:bacteriocin n=1 Tax=Chryseobacterium arthrosphaerae TaxID=651561 RepID=UPI0023E2B0AF|nr:bacteriocin [Chryseobacterium arthrosphaerae]WES99868.1 bacteriocin [Chryseobacterium arthrosphaerae]